MTISQRQSLSTLRSGLPGHVPEDHGDWEMMDDILDGSSQLDISHEGGEFYTVVQDIEEELWQAPRYFF